MANALSELLPADRVWLLGEQMKLLIGDWVNQQGDVGIDLLYYLQEPTRILSEEIQRIDREHQRQIAELRAEIEALKQAIRAKETNTSTKPSPAPPPAQTNSVVASP